MNFDNFAVRTEGTADNADTAAVCIAVAAADTALCRLPADCRIADSMAAADLQADRTADYNFGCTVCRRCFDNIRFAAAV